MKRFDVAILVLAVVAGQAVFAGHASASKLTSPANTVYTDQVKGGSIGHAQIHNPIQTIECTGVLVADVDSHGIGVPVLLDVTTIVFTPCTDSWHLTVVAGGSLAITGTGGGNGTISSSGLTVEATRFGISCRYATSSTSLGTVTGGTPARWDLQGAIPFHSGSFLCGSGATSITGAFELTSPSNLIFDP